MRPVVSMLAAAAALALLGGQAAAADDPHTTTSAAQPELCAVCHQVQGDQVSPRLIRPTVYELCMSCHDGLGSALDVLDGVRLTATGPQGAGQTGQPLNGGGFAYLNGSPVTSRHAVQTSLADPGASQPWGYQTSPGNKGTSLATPLTCTSCHDPHGSPNYRSLRQQVNGYTVSVLAFYDGDFTRNEGDVGLGPGAPPDKYVREYYGSNGLIASGGYRPDVAVGNPADPSLNGIALLCGACHTSYASSSGTTIPGTNPYSITSYRHRTEMPYTTWRSPKYGGPVPNNPELDPYKPDGGSPLPALRLASNPQQDETIVTCLTCHRAHGTAAEMSGYALAARPDGSSPTPGSVSALLVSTNRSMCEACHQW